MCAHTMSLSVINTLVVCFSIPLNIHLTHLLVETWHISFIKDNAAIAQQLFWRSHLYSSSWLQCGLHVLQAGCVLYTQTTVLHQGRLNKPLPCCLCMGFLCMLSISAVHKDRHWNLVLTLKPSINIFKTVYVPGNIKTLHVSV